MYLVALNHVPSYINDNAKYGRFPTSSAGTYSLKQLNFELVGGNSFC